MGHLRLSTDELIDVGADLRLVARELDSANARSDTLAEAVGHAGLAARVLPYLRRCAAHGVQVLVGDPDRGHLPPDGLELVASYPVPTTEPSVDSPVRRVQVLRPR